MPNGTSGGVRGRLNSSYSIAHNSIPVTVIMRSDLILAEIVERRIPMQRMPTLSDSDMKLFELKNRYSRNYLTFAGNSVW